LDDWRLEILADRPIGEL
jgi:hypothetical protein